MIHIIKQIFYSFQDRNKNHFEKVLSNFKRQSFKSKFYLGELFLPKHWKDSEKPHADYKYFEVVFYSMPNNKYYVRENRKFREILLNNYWIDQDGKIVR